MRYAAAVILLSAVLALTACSTRPPLLVRASRNPSGRVKTAYSFYRDKTGREVLHGERYIYAGGGIVGESLVPSGSLGVPLRGPLIPGEGSGILETYEDGRLVATTRFTLNR